MKDQLILFETAKLAKERGFDINTTSNCWVKTLDGDIIHNSERKDTPEHDRSEQYLMQPTQTLLQKWLREEHDISVSIETEWHGGQFYYGVYIWDGFNDDENLEGFIFPLYEDALEKGLVVGLKLVKK